MWYVSPNYILEECGKKWIWSHRRQQYLLKLSLKWDNIHTVFFISFSILKIQWYFFQITELLHRKFCTITEIVNFSNVLFHGCFSLSVTKIRKLVSLYPLLPKLIVIYHKFYSQLKNIFRLIQLFCYVAFIL